MTSRREEFDLADNLIAHDYQKLAHDLIQTFNLPIWELRRGIARNGKLEVFKLYEEKIKHTRYCCRFCVSIRANVIPPIFSTELLDYLGHWGILRCFATNVCKFVKSALRVHSLIGLRWCLNNMKDSPPKDWSVADGIILHAECKHNVRNDEEDALLQAICQIRVNGHCEYDEIYPERVHCLIMGCAGIARRIFPGRH
jgi:hypothetical protein